MGEVARTVLEGLGPDYVIGVIPEALTSREISKTMLGTTFVVDDMVRRRGARPQAYPRVVRTRCSRADGCCRSVRSLARPCVLYPSVILCVGSTEPLR